MATDILERILAGHGTGLASFTVDQYHQMIETGILTESSRIELLDGLLVLKDRRDQGGKPMNVGPRHSVLVTRLLKAIQQVGETDQTHVRCQQPITLPPDNEPEPDIAIVVGPPDDYFDRHPGAAETVAVMEVADSSLRQDREIKQRIYADAGIETYWIIDVSANHIEVYTQPQSGLGRYGHMQTAGPGDLIPLALPGGAVANVDASDVLP